MSSKLSRSEKERQGINEGQEFSSSKKCLIIGFLLSMIVIGLLAVVGLVLVLVMIFKNFPC